jgi:hypothetical protein
MVVRSALLLPRKKAAQILQHFAMTLFVTFTERQGLFVRSLVLVLATPSNLLVAASATTHLFMAPSIFYVIK